jgi:lipopolysaccharide/colanic/teichoic acid biosynthesis glycosyltransferase
MVLTAKPRRVAKRALDIVLSALALCLLIPLLAAVALLVRVTMGGPVLFRQVRAGRGGKPFVLYKFRSLRDLYLPDGTLAQDSDRLTPFGRLLRSTSLDELPELLNVLTGDMSLVGPRPLLMEYLPLYTPEQARRHDVRPGITGWAQVQGRNAITWEQKFELDVWYVDHHSLLLDCRILWRTIALVLRREGISHEGQATMARFGGPRS